MVFFSTGDIKIPGSLYILQRFFDEDLQVFNQCYEEVNYFNTKCNIINLLIPTQSPDNLNSPIFHTSQVDFARDAYHFDYKTAEIYVEHILSGNQLELVKWLKIYYS